MCTAKSIQSYIVHHQSVRRYRPTMWTLISWFVCQGRLPFLMDIGPPCAPWCTAQVGGAQRRSVMHNVVLYRWISTQCRSHTFAPHESFRTPPVTISRLLHPTTLRPTTVYCAPPRSELKTNMQSPLVHHLWCTTQVRGAQHRLVVHNVVLYPRSFAQLNVGLTNPDRQVRCYYLDRWCRR